MLCMLWTYSKDFIFIGFFLLFVGLTHLCEIHILSWLFFFSITLWVNLLLRNIYITSVERKYHNTWENKNLFPKWIVRKEKEKVKEEEEEEEEKKNSRSVLHLVCVRINVNFFLIQKKNFFFLIFINYMNFPLIKENSLFWKNFHLYGKFKKFNFPKSKNFSSTVKKWHLFLFV